MKGIWVSLVTPFDENLNLDIKAIERYIRFIDQYDFDGFLLGGSVGEGLLLSLDELSTYIEIVRNITKKPIMGGIIEFNYAHAREKIHLNVDYLLVTPPIYFRPHAAAIIAYIKEIALNSGKKIVLYNNPGRVGAAMDYEIYDALYAIENIVAVKECDDLLVPAMAVRYPNWSILTGNDGFYARHEGAVCGVISSLANVAPNLVFEVAKEQETHIWSELCNYAYNIPNPIAVKLIFNKLGLMQTHFRACFSPLPNFEYFDYFIKDNKLIF